MSTAIRACKTREVIVRDRSKSTFAPVGPLHSTKRGYWMFDHYIERTVIADRLGYSELKISVTIIAMN